VSFFGNEFYQELGLELAALAVDLEAFFRRQAEIFGDLSVRVSGPQLPQFHVEITTPGGAPVRLVTFTARRVKDNNPDVQFAAVEKALPALDSATYRAEVLRRLGDLVEHGAATDHRFVKFSYDRLREPAGLEQGLRAFEWMLGQLRCAAAAEAAGVRAA
jgi:hypothetical protein